MKRNPAVTRREFLKDSALFIGGAAVTVSGLACVASYAPVVRVTVADRTIAVETAIPELMNVGDGIQLASEELDYPILLIKIAPERFVALSTECMHLGCTVKKQPSLIRCPCHGSVYDLEGNVLKGPTQHPLMQYAVRMSGTQAIVVAE